MINFNDYNRVFLDDVEIDKSTRTIPEFDVFIAIDGDLYLYS